MSTQVLDKLKSLPPDKQQEVADFVDFLANKYALPKLSREELIEKRSKAFGSMRGQIRMADDFNETPEDFKDYL